MDAISLTFLFTNFFPTREGSEDSSKWRPNITASEVASILRPQNFSEGTTAQSSPAPNGGSGTAPPKAAHILDISPFSPSPEILSLPPNGFISQTRLLQHLAR